MGSLASRHTLAGMLFGAGIALFFVYVLTDEAAVGLTLTRPQRLGMGVLGLALGGSGLLLGQLLRRAAGTAADAESGAAPAGAAKPAPAGELGYSAAVVECLRSVAIADRLLAHLRAR
ncbi:MAG: hypothetical protein U0840_01885 [Gemmataceae bacterium]